MTGATGYKVKRSTTAGGPYTTIASNVTGTSYEDDNVMNGTTYYYVVTAVGANGEALIPTKLRPLRRHPVDRSFCGLP